MADTQESGKYEEVKTLLNAEENPPLDEIKRADDTDENSNSRKKESTRTFIAQLYVWAFFAIILLVFVTGWCNCFKVEDYKDMLIAVSGTLSGPLGFIVGYYFKASKE